MAPIIQVKNVLKQYGKHKVLDNVSMDINRGEIFGIIGMSGSGKTTLLNTIIGFLNPEEGDVLFQPSSVIDRDSKSGYRSIFKNKLILRKVFGFAPQLPSFYLQLTARENLEYFASLYGLQPKEMKANIDHLLELTGLTPSQDLLAMELSGGMQKRLGISCALVHKPEILILDEPTADLDPILRTQTWNLIKKINQQGTTVIIASHFIEEIESLCDRIGIIHDGKLLSLGSPMKLKDIYTKSDEIHVETVSHNYASLMRKLKSKSSFKISKISVDGKRLVIYTDKANETMKYILHSSHEKILAADINRPTLTEVFESLAQGKSTLFNHKH